jgi:hypothetical protein
MTPGYKLFQGDTEGLMVSFEYPEDWVLSTENPDEHRQSIFIKFGSSSPEWVHSCVLIESYPIPYHKPPIAYEDAHDLIYDKTIGNYPIIPPDLVSGAIVLGGIQGETVSYSADEPNPMYYHSPDPEILHILYRHVAVDYKGRIYWILYDINTNLDDNDSYEPGFEHLLATFRFLE